MNPTNRPEISPGKSASSVSVGQVTTAGPAMLGLLLGTHGQGHAADCGTSGSATLDVAQAALGRAVRRSCNGVDA